MGKNTFFTCFFCLCLVSICFGFPFQLSGSSFTKVEKSLFCFLEEHEGKSHNFADLHRKYVEINDNPEQKFESSCTPLVNYFWDLELALPLSDTAFLADDLQQRREVERLVDKQLKKQCGTIKGRACIVFIRTDLLLARNDHKEDLGWAAAILKTFEELNRQFVLVSFTYEDLCVPYRTYPMFHDEMDPRGVREIDALLNSPLLLIWHAKNPCLHHPKLSGIPIGLKWHPHCTMFHCNRDTFLWNAFEPYSEPKKSMGAFGVNKTTLLSPPIFELANTGSSMYKPHRGTRPKVFEYLGNAFGQSYIDQVHVRSTGYPLVEHVEMTKYLTDISNSKFVFSPSGNGIDCHRTWESLILGSVVVMQSSPLNEMYHGLPVIFVRNWEKVDGNYLEKIYPKMLEEKKKYKWSKLSALYWIHKILFSATLKSPAV